MRKSLTYKILAAVLAACSLGLYAAAPAAAADDYTVNNDGETLNDEYNNIYGNGYSFTINGGTIKGYVSGVGKKGYTGDASGGNVTINGNADVKAKFTAAGHSAATLTTILLTLAAMLK